jgi:hypothetical protein
MHPRFARADRFPDGVIDTAIEMHRIIGPGLLESIDKRRLIKLVDGISRLVPPSANNT